MRSLKEFHSSFILYYFILVIGITMLSQNPIWVLTSFFFASIYYIEIYQVKKYFRNLLFFIPLLLFIILMNSFFSGLGLTVLFTIGRGNPITLESILYGLFNGLLLCSIYLWFASYHSLLSNDEWIGIMGYRFPTIGLAISMIMKYVPDTISQGEQILYQQKAMLGDEKLKAKQKMNFAAKLLTVLLSWSMENSLDTADSMAAKGYPSPMRKNYNKDYFTKRDKFAFLLLSGFLILQLSLMLLGNSRFAYYPFLKWQGQSRGIFENIISIGSLFMINAFPLLLNAYHFLYWKWLSGKREKQAQSQRKGIVIYE